MQAVGLNVPAYPQDLRLRLNALSFGLPDGLQLLYVGGPFGKG